MRTPHIVYWSALLGCLLASFCARFRFGASFLSFYSDDYFYYLKVAQNIVTHHLSTFDGSTATNGYHPLWMAVNVFLLFAFRGKAFFYALALLSIACSIATFLLICKILKMRGLSEPAALFTGFVSVWWSLKIVSGEMEVVIAIPLAFAMLAWILRPTFSWSRDSLVYGLLASLAILARLDIVILVALLLAFQGIAHLSRAGFAAKDLIRGAVRFALGGLLLPVYVITNVLYFGILSPVSSAAKHLKPGLTPYFDRLLPITRADLTAHGGFQGWFYILPLVIAVVALVGLTISSMRRGKFDRPVLFALYLFPLVHLLLLATLSDWALWMWYFYPDVFVICFACMQCFEWADGAALARAFVPLRYLAMIAVLLVAARTIRTQLTLMPEYNGIYATGVELAKFMDSHPGRYAMGDRAGIVGYLSESPVVQLEGLVMDKNYIDVLRYSPRLKDVLAQYHVDYYITSGRHLAGSCYAVVEPSQAGPQSPKMRGTFCDAPVFTVQRGPSFDAVFRVRRDTAASPVATPIVASGLPSALAPNETHHSSSSTR
jgi:hypothetical protein